MNSVLRTADPLLYLAESEFINWQNPEVLLKAQELHQIVINRTSKADKTEIARCCFEFVRDEIYHSVDYQMNPVTCKASDVLAHGTGYCYAKSHLLAALLRANGIPAGLCYQRLTIGDEDGDDGPFSLHGLNAVWLEEYGWYRIDPRGNRLPSQGKVEVRAEFTPPHEALAYPIRVAGEADLPEIWAEPLPVVVQALGADKSWDQVLAELPDTELLVW
ncbi:transglutaminase-like domain-containing protein [Oceanospirillum sediminis]|uniref:Transglutaminase family protein n=1 Tax=Oceanospirillum sediminis TaxID=2760088 RepID=A0A839INB5_9GAMM|nr:transglutaminase family protein [Oceanospirillum sediminis]MBB1486391.1 transglutaminase family protein [Oceanospirillum sediminis]